MSILYTAIYIIAINIFLIFLANEDSKDKTIPFMLYTVILIAMLIFGLPIIFGNGILLFLSAGELASLFFMRKVLAKADLMFMAILSLTLPLLTVVCYAYFVIRLLQKDIKGREFPFFRELEAAFFLASMAYFIFFFL